MTAIVIALAFAVWLFVVLLCVGLAQAAARSDMVMTRALALERRRAAGEREPRLRRAA